MLCRRMITCVIIAAIQHNVIPAKAGIHSFCYGKIQLSPVALVSSTGQALSLSKGAVVVRQTHHERLYYPTFCTNRH
jgi:hypothetical protein